MSSEQEEAAEKIASMITTWAYEAWKDAGLSRPKELTRVYAYWSGCINWGFILQQRFGEDNVDAYFALEGQTDMQASTLLVISGYARHGNALLRGWLENIFLGLWFGFDKRSYEKWKRSDEDRPFKDRSFFKEAWLSELLNKTPFKKYNREKKLINRIMELYKELSIAVHAQDIKTHETSTWGDSVARFRPELFDKWFERMVHIFEVMSIVLFLRYPMLMKKGGKELQEIMKLLPQNVVEDLKPYL